MRMPRRRTAAIAAAATACAVAAGLGAYALWPQSKRYGYPPPHKTAVLDKQARTVLVAWDREHPGQPVRQYMPVARDVPNNRWGWTFVLPPDTELERLGGHRLSAAVPLPETSPAPSTVVWQDGAADRVPLVSAAEAFTAAQAERCRQEPCDGPAMRVTGAEMGAVPARTTHGWASVPAWVFTVEGAAFRVARIAVDAEPPPHRESFSGGEYARVARGIVHATAENTLTVEYLGAPSGTGPCSGEYTAHVVEGASAVVVVVEPMVPPEWVLEEARNVSCAPLSPFGPYRQATVYLSRPLGERVLLGLEGTPLMLTRQRP
ncbi:hypothetical protein [Micromonospora sp. CPCC 206061]|uniref:hypothetical protein n=1 Tax=Micromonospora sp. CPCC 206061 TaxID=3122410 RepID=UPI002FF38E61